MNTVLKVFTLLILFYSVVCFAQDPKIDRLRMYIEKAHDDSTKVDTLIELAKMLSDINPDAGLVFAKNAVDLGKKIKYPRGTAKALKCIGNVYGYKSIYVEAINYYQQSEKIFDSIGDKGGVANIQSNMGAIYFNQGEDTKANEYYFIALRTAEEIHDSVRTRQRRRIRQRNFMCVHWK